MLFKASYFTLIAGHGIGRTSLNAFDNALHNAGVGNYNLIKVSSILPPLCKQSVNIGVPQGSLLPVAYGSISSSNIGEEIVASVGIGIPVDSSNIGVIMEYASKERYVDADKIVRRMIEDAMRERNIPVSEILLKSCRHTVHDKFSCAFAAVALW